MKQSSINYLILIIVSLSFIVIGCQRLDNFAGEGFQGAADALDPIDISFNFSFSALSTADATDLPSQSFQPSRSILPGGPSYDMDFTTPKTFDGTVAFQPLPSGDPLTFDITATLDASWDAVLQQTFVLPTGTYDVTVVFGDTEQQYLGAANSVTILETGVNDIGVTVYPVLGETIIESTITDDIPLFYFEYESDEFSGLTPPVIMTVIIDNTGDTDFSLQEFTGDTRTYVNLSGTHDVRIEIRSNNTVVARYEAQNVEFQMGMAMEMNLTPIYGTATFTLAEQGSDATFNFTVPASVVSEIDAEVGGSLADNDYFFIFKMTGINNDPTSDQLALTLDGSGDYHGLLTYSNFQYDTLNIEIEIWDTTDDIIGTCAFTMDMSADTISEICGFTLYRRAAITGHVLQVLGINVIDVNGNMVDAGTRIYVDGILEGLTGGPNVTDGFLTIFLEPGDHDIYALDVSGDTSSDITTFTAESWGIDTILLELN